MPQNGPNFGPIWSFQALIDPKMVSYNITFIKKWFFKCDQSPESLAPPGTQPPGPLAPQAPSPLGPRFRVFRPLAIVALSLWPWAHYSSYWIFLIIIIIVGLLLLLLLLSDYHYYHIIIIIMIIMRLSLLLLDYHYYCCP